MNFVHQSIPAVPMPCVPWWGQKAVQMPPGYSKKNEGKFFESRLIKLLEGKLSQQRSFFPLGWYILLVRIENLTIPLSNKQ